MSKHLKGYPCPQCGKKTTVYIQYGLENHKCRYCEWTKIVPRPNALRPDTGFVSDFKGRLSEILEHADEQAHETIVEQMEQNPKAVEALYGDGNQDDGFEAHCDEMARLGDERYI